MNEQDKKEIVGALLVVAACMDKVEAKAEGLLTEALGAVSVVRSEVERSFDRHTELMNAVGQLLEGMGEVRKILADDEQDSAAFKVSVLRRLTDLEKGRTNGAHR